MAVIIWIKSAELREYLHANAAAVNRFDASTLRCSLHCISMRISLRIPRSTSKSIHILEQRLHFFPDTIHI